MANRPLLLATSIWLMLSCRSTAPEAAPAPLTFPGLRGARLVSQRPECRILEQRSEGRPFTRVDTVARASKVSLDGVRTRNFPDQVVLRYVVDAMGQADTSWVSMSGARPADLEAMKRALRLWTFRPAVVDGCAVAAVATDTLRFRVIGPAH